MARPFKNGLEYFPLDVDIFNDDKLFDVQNKYGAIGEVVYLRMLCLVYRNGYYYDFQNKERLASILIRSIGNKWINDKSEVLEIVELIVECGLFSGELFAQNILTSHGIQERYIKTTDRRRKSVDEHSLIKKTDDNIKSSENNLGDVKVLKTGNKTCESKKDSDVSGFDREVSAEKNTFAENKTENADENNTDNVCSNISKEALNESYCSNNRNNCRNNGVNVYNNPPKKSKVKKSKEKKSKVQKSKVCVLELPATDGNYLMYQDYYDHLTHTYPNINIDESLVKIRNYLLLNPEKQGPKERLSAYIELWLSDDNKRAGLGKLAGSGDKSRSYRSPTEEGLPGTYDISEYESFSVIDAAYD